MAIRLPTASRNAAADAVVDRADAGSGAGTIDIRTGGQPTSANDAATGTLLATITLADPAFGAATGGVTTLDADPDLETTGLADGTPGWFRMKDSDGGTVLDGAVGSDLTLSAGTIATGATVRITSGTVTMPAG